jgi:hypothetical protein
VDQDWLGRVLAGSIGLYALALLAQPLAPRFGLLATVVLAAASGAEVEPGVMEPRSRRSVRWKVIETRDLHGESV